MERLVQAKFLEDYYVKVSHNLLKQYLEELNRDKKPNLKNLENITNTFHLMVCSLKAIGSFELSKLLEKTFAQFIHHELKELVAFFSSNSGNSGNGKEVVSADNHRIVLGIFPECA